MRPTAKKGKFENPMTTVFPVCKSRRPGLRLEDASRGDDSNFRGGRGMFGRIATGKIIMGAAITEPNAGSDVTAAVTSAIREGDEYIINGSKMFITNGDVADFILVFCQTDPDISDRHRRHSWIIVERDRKGFESNKLQGKLGIRACDTAELSFSEVRVPLSNLEGAEGIVFKE